QILKKNLSHWVGNATQVIHLDFHTGLGKKATYKLLTKESTESETAQWLIDKFGSNLVETKDRRNTGYLIRGGLGTWCQATLSQCQYYFVTAEFGTYPLLQVLEALRQENYAHFWTPSDESFYQNAKKRLLEVFAPIDQHWRNAVVSKGLALVKKAISICPKD
ncbi:MAG: DUF2817 domain-containing protein, partial [Okeania sp. SIO2D1]|nr:DUF2817 domain-containing protein [Okeania sp. SIO2D1]